MRETKFRGKRLDNGEWIEGDLLRMLDHWFIFPNPAPEQVYKMRIAGFSFNQISLYFRLDWGCVKQRYEDFIHDNPELQKGGEK